MYKTIQFIQADGTGSFQAMQKATLKTNIWVYAGLACIFLPGIFTWLLSGMKFDALKLRIELLESVLPSYGRAIPIWAQILRVGGGILLVIFNLKSITLVNGELDMTFDYFWVMILGALLFFCLPFLFHKIDKSS